MKKKFLSLFLALSMMASLIVFPTAVSAKADAVIKPESVKLENLSNGKYRLSFEFTDEYASGGNQHTLAIYTQEWIDSGMEIELDARPTSDTVDPTDLANNAAVKIEGDPGEVTVTSYEIEIPAVVYNTKGNKLYIGYWTSDETDTAAASTVFTIDKNGKIVGPQGQVNLNLNGGTLPTGKTSPVTLDAKAYADSAALTTAINVTPTKAGFKFGGWTSNADGTTLAGLTLAKDATEEVYAVWTAKDTLTADNFTKSADVDYNGSAQKVTVSPAAGTNGITVANITIKYDGAESATGKTDAGTYPITIDVAETENYAAITGLPLGDWKIKKASSTVGWKDKTKTYNGAAQAPTATIPKVPSGNMAASDFELQYKSGTDADFAAANAHTNAGTYSVKAVLGTDAAKNYTLTDDTIADFVINKAAPKALKDTPELSKVKVEEGVAVQLPPLTDVKVEGVGTDADITGQCDISYEVVSGATISADNKITLNDGAANAVIKITATAKADSTNYTGAVSSANITLNSKETVAATLAVAVNPAKVTVGGKATYTATVTGKNPADATVKYQWYKQTGADPAPATDTKVGTDSETYETDATVADDIDKAQTYYCVVTVSKDGYNDFTDTKGASFTVEDKPADPDVEATVAIEADKTTVTEGTPVTLTAKVDVTKPATGATPAYQWKKDGANIDGATDPTYTIANPTQADSGEYTCEVTVSAPNHTAKAFTPAAPVKITVEKEATYTVTAKTPTNGTYKYKVGDDAEKTVTTADDTTLNVAKGTKVTITETTPASGYKYSSVTVKDADNKTVTVNKTDKSFVMPESNVTITVNFAKSGGGGGGGGGVTSYTVRYDVGKNGKITEGKASESVAKNASPKAVPTVTANEGFKFLGWSIDGETTVDPTAQKITKATTFKALYEEEAAPTPTPTPTAKPDTNSHKEYIYGYEDGDFRPENGITRAETAAIFARALTDYAEGTTYESAGFTDLDGTEWFINNVNYLANTGVITGYEDGTFRPYDSISRQEFATMITRLGEVLEAGDMPFSDVSEENWGIDYIYTAYTNGLVTGYEDGTFRPESDITRAEAVTIVNGYLGREVDEAGLADATYTTFPDVTPSHWAYFEVIEAANAHDFAVDSKPEVWVD